MESENFLFHMTPSVEGNDITNRSFSLQNDKFSDICGHAEPIANISTSVERVNSGSSTWWWDSSCCYKYELHRTTVSVSEPMTGKANDFMAEVREANPETALVSVEVRSSRRLQNAASYRSTVPELLIRIRHWMRIGI